jgi:hypothetical protein
MNLILHFRGRAAWDLGPTLEIWTELQPLAKLPGALAELLLVYHITNASLFRQKRSIISLRVCPPCHTPMPICICAYITHTHTLGRHRRLSFQSVVGLSCADLNCAHCRYGLLLRPVSSLWTEAGGGPTGAEKPSSCLSSPGRWTGSLTPWLGSTFEPPSGPSYIGGRGALGSYTGGGMAPIA